MKYPKIKVGGEGYIFDPQETTLKIACCDCGLVHYYAFEIIDNKIKLQVFSDKRATAQLRRHKYGKLQHCSKAKYEMVKK